MPRIDAVAIDLDGTLLEPGGRILPEALAALEAAWSRGIRVLIATGRPRADILELLRRNGLLEAPYPHALIAEERDIHDRDGAAFTPREPRNGDHLGQERALSAEIGPAVAACRRALAEIDPGHRAVDAARVAERGFHELWFSTEEAAAAAAALLKDRLQTAGLKVVHNRRGVALRHACAGKGRVLAELAGGWGLPLERVLAVGDAENDRSMLGGPFLCATPANAEPAIAELVRSRGGFLAPAPRGAGVAQAIAAFLDGGAPAGAPQA